MGKPIAGQNKYPFKIMGLLVDSAKIDGVTYTKTLYVYKQTSSFMFDLIEGSTGKIFKDVLITWKDSDGRNLKYYDPALIVSQKLPERTFARKVQSTRQNIYGYLVMLHENKVKVSTGQYLFYEDDYDLDLVGVMLTPQSIVVRRGETASFNVSFIPPEYTNTSGVWTSMDNSVASIATNVNNTATFNTHTVGETAVYFTPDSNKTIVAGGYIYVIPEDETPELTSISIQGYIPSKNPQQISEAIPLIFPGTEVLLDIAFIPSGYVPTSPATFVYDDRYVESITMITYSQYMVKATKSLDGFTTFSVTASFEDDGRIISSYISFGFSEQNVLTVLNGIPNSLRPGQTYYLPINYSPDSMIWKSEDESIVKVVEPGVLLGVNEGTVDFSITTPDNKTFWRNILVSKKCADYVTVNEASIGEYGPGDEVQYELVVYPPECAQYYPTNWAILSPTTVPASISPTGLFSVGEIEPNLAATPLYMTPFKDVPNLPPFVGTGASPAQPINLGFVRTIGNRDDEIDAIYVYPSSPTYIRTGKNVMASISVSPFVSGKKYTIEYTISGDDGVISVKQPDTWKLYDNIENSSLIIEAIKPGKAVITITCDILGPETIEYIVY